MMISLFPDIQSVSYDSDGKNLNATLWLNSQFREPPLNDTIDTFQEELNITVSDTNSTVQEYSDLKLARLLDPSIVPTLEENTSICFLGFKQTESHILPKHDKMS
jgi:hypothetical protein